jgi:hypothetical protein
VEFWTVFPLAFRTKTGILVTVEIFLTICIGIGLSAACGFRVFVPLLCLSIAAHVNYVTLSPGFAWIGSTPAMIALGVATVLEICAYYIPWLDNLLDTVAIPAATVAGIVATASVITDIDPFFKWTLAVIAGGGIATTTQLTTTKARVTSSATTGGLGNPFIATIENVLSTVLSVVAVIWPFVAIGLVVLVLVACGLIIFYTARALMKVFKRKQESPGAITMAS